MVDRFDYVGGSYPMGIRPNGEYVEYEDYAALEARVAELEKDAARIDFLADGPVIEGFVCSDFDVYDYAIVEAEERGNEEPSADDQRSGFRRMIDEAMSREA